MLDFMYRREHWFEFNAFSGFTAMGGSILQRLSHNAVLMMEPDQKFKPDVDGDISGWQYTSCGRSRASKAM